MMLKNFSTLPPDHIEEEDAAEKCKDWIEALTHLQEKLMAQQKFAVLIIIQGMDASGKDGAIKKVFSGVNPAGCRVKSFKVPTAEEAAHDFLWRIHKECPEKGFIQIFNRSHYEDILVPSVHALLPHKVLDFRLKAIHQFEKLLVESGTIVLKFYLHVSEKEQLARINERIVNPHKRWKYQKADLLETSLRDQYLKVYQHLIDDAGTVPWHVVPSDKNWYKNYFLLKTIVEELNKYPIHFPEIEL